MNHTYRSIFDEVMNTACCEIVTFFDKEKGTFVMHNIYEAKEDENLILLPYREECHHLAMRKFWSSLDNGDRALAESFNEKHGFFDFLRKTGLIFAYYDAETSAVCAVLDDWKCSNNLSFYWDTVEYI